MESYLFIYIFMLINLMEIMTSMLIACHPMILIWLLKINNLHQVMVMEIVEMKLKMAILIIVATTVMKTEVEEGVEAASFLKYFEKVSMKKIKIRGRMKCD